MLEKKDLEIEDEEDEIEEDEILAEEKLSPKEKKIIYKQVDLGGFIETKVRMKNFRDFDEAVGVDGIQFIGLPGSGKTSFAMLIAKDLIKSRGENILLSADRFCEFRHYFRYPRFVKKIWLFLPEIKTQVLYFHGIPNIDNNSINEELVNRKYKIPFEIRYVDFETFNINDYLTDDTKGNVFAMYDQHFQGTFLWKRAELWTKLTKQLLERTVLLDDAITTLFNEAGVLWKEGASGNHWNAVKEYSEIVVECRKGLVRPMHLSQLETEQVHTVRKKMLWKCYRLGTTSGKGIPLAVRKAAPFQSRSAYILMYGNLYSIGNQTPKLSELKEKWKIIPIGYPNIEDKDEKKSLFMERETIIRMLYEHGETQGAIAKLMNLSQQRIAQILQE